MKLLDTMIVTHECTISEDTLRDRLEREMLEGLGLIHEGKVAAGVSINTLRGDSRKGGYRVRVTRDMSKDQTPRIAAPEKGDR
jgi:hypothetical protein